MNKEDFLIEPEIKHTRKDLFILILIGILFFASGELLYPVLRPNRSQYVPFTNGLFILLSTSSTIYYLSRKVYQSIYIDYKNRILKIEYITLLKNNCENIILFHELEYEYKKNATRSGVKWSLIIWGNKTKILDIEESNFGFEKEKLDLLVEELKEINN